MPIVKLDLTHNLCPGQTWAELPFDDHIPLQQVKSKICRHVGSQEEFVKLFFCSDGKSPDVVLDDLQKSLSDYMVIDRSIIHVVDEDPNSILKDINDVENAPRFRLTDEQYAAKKGTAKEFLAKLRAEKPELFRKAEQGNTQEEERGISKEDLEEAERKYLSQRCEIKGTSVRGTICWVGSVTDTLRVKYGLPEKKIIIGIKLDDSVGNFDGKDENDKILFECSNPKGGALVPLERIIVGSDLVPLADSSKDEI